MIWTTGKERTLKQMRADGKTWKEVGEALGCTTGAASSRAWQMGKRRSKGSREPATSGPHIFRVNLDDLARR